MSKIKNASKLYLLRVRSRWSFDAMEIEAIKYGFYCTLILLIELILIVLSPFIELIIIITLWKKIKN